MKSTIRAVFNWQIFLEFKCKISVKQKTGTTEIKCENILNRKTPWAGYFVSFNFTVRFQDLFNVC